MVLELSYKVYVTGIDEWFLVRFTQHEVLPILKVLFGVEWLVPLSRIENVPGSDFEAKICCLY
jgi:hypothetical protein